MTYRCDSCAGRREFRTVSAGTNSTRKVEGFCGTAAFEKVCERPFK